MKKIISVAIALMVLSSCTSIDKEFDGRFSLRDNHIKRFYATTEQNGAETKVYADENLKVLWNADDRISIFNKNSYNYQYRFDGETGANAGSLSVIPPDGFITGNDLDYVYAVYPYLEGTTISNAGELTMTLPRSQTYKENSFGIGSNIMVAVTDNSFLAFRNLCGYLCVKLYGDNIYISSITLTGNNGEKLAGKALVTATVGGMPTMSFDNAATNELTLECPTPVKIGSTAETATSFWFVVPPTSFTEGFKITVTDYKGAIFEKSTSNAIAIQRNTLESMAAIEYVKPEPPSPSEIISFADEKVKTKLVAAFDTDKDGELSYIEAAAVTDERQLQSAFGSIKTYKSFDEFQYFTGITRIPDNMFEGWILTSIILPESIKTIGRSAFKGCTKLTSSIVIPEGMTSVPFSLFEGCAKLSSVTIPEGVTKIDSYAFCGCSSMTSILIPEGVATLGYEAFSGCTALVSIDIPASVTSIDLRAFFGCTSLTSINIPESVTSISTSTFSGCTSLSSIYIPESVTSISHRAFFGCTSLTSINIPESVTSVGEEAFCGCVSLASINIPESVTSIGNCVFYGCTNLTSVYMPESVVSIGVYSFFECSSLVSIAIPESVSSIGYQAFGGCTNLASIIIPESVTEIGGYAFCGCNSLTSITIMAIIVPSGAGDMFDVATNCPIYVPEESVEAYKTSQYWNAYADRIQPIQQ